METWKNWIEINQVEWVPCPPEPSTFREIKPCGLNIQEVVVSLFRSSVKDMNHKIKLIRKYGDRKCCVSSISYILPPIFILLPKLHPLSLYPSNRKSETVFSNIISRTSFPGFKLRKSIPQSMDVRTYQAKMLR